LLGTFYDMEFILFNKFNELKCVFVPVIGTIFCNKIIWLLLQCFAFLNTNVHFAHCVWQNCGRYSDFICGLVQGYANCMRYLVAHACLISSIPVLMAAGCGHYHSSSPPARLRLFLSARHGYAKPKPVACRPKDSIDSSIQIPKKINR